LIKKGVERYLSLKNDRVYLSNSIKRTFARGFDYEIFSAALLEEAMKNDQSSAIPSMSPPICTQAGHMMW